MRSTDAAQPTVTNLTSSHSFRDWPLLFPTINQVVLIVEEAGGSVLEAQGELITTQYFDSLAAEVDDMLQVWEHSAVDAAHMHCGRALTWPAVLLSAAL